MALCVFLCGAWLRQAQALSPAEAGRSRDSVVRTPSLVFILLDTARSDRFSAWGNPRATSPEIDALARAGIRFDRHYATSHATRPSMPQIMSGRYYHRSILRSFESREHPREYYFVAADPTAVLLPELLRKRGYYLTGVSTHPWVVEDSSFGRFFDRLDFLPAGPGRGHEDAGPALDRTIEIWRSRPRDRPVFLYLHLLDLHTPRWLPDGKLRFVDPSVEWRDRFSPGLEPRFGRERRLWNHNDARDFTDRDRTIYAAAYDTMVAYTDREVGRLLAVLRSEDPELRSVLVAIVADHGEELGGEGRIKHGGSLAEGVQHVPFVLAGAGIPPGQEFTQFSQNVDVTPTIARLLGLDENLPDSVFDGRALVGNDGIVRASRGRHVVYYTWVDYQAVRTSRWLLRLDPPGAPETICRGRRELLWRLDGPSRVQVPIEGRYARVAAKLERKIDRHLGRRVMRFRAAPWQVPDRRFLVPAEYWRMVPGSMVRCPPEAAGFDANAVAGAGWLYVRKSFFIKESGSARPLQVTMSVPDGRYHVELGVVPIRSLWWLPGFGRWLRDGFHAGKAERFVPLGTYRAGDRTLAVAISPDQAQGQRVLSLRLTPLGAGGAPEDDATPVDREQLERLRTLGYVE